MPRNTACFLCVLSIAAGLFGCASNPWVQKLGETIGIDTRGEAIVHIELSPVDKPVYRRNAVFVYGKDRVRAVTHVDGETIVWSNLIGEVYRTNHNFFTPRTRQVYDDRVVTASLDGQPEDLWPLAVGKSVTFTEQRRTSWLADGRETMTTRHWQCEVDDARISVVPAGTFEVFRVTCQSFRPRERRPVVIMNWDYAPAMTHYVRRIWYNPRSKRRSEHQLTAALPASLATQQRLDAILKRLREIN